jgi:hypothetical protein
VEKRMINFSLSAHFVTIKNQPQLSFHLSAFWWSLGHSIDYAVVRSYPSRKAALIRNSRKWLVKFYMK